MVDGQTFFLAGSVVFIFAGGAHVLGTLLDTVRPTFFTPIDRSVRPVVEGTGIRLVGRPAPSMWRVWLGIHITHGLGAVAFGLLCLVTAAHDFDLVDRIGAFRPVTVAVSFAYLAVCLRFFYYAPKILITVATACFAASALSA